MTALRLDRAAAAGFGRVRRDPAGWIARWLDADLWETQVAIAESVRDHRRTAVKSCHASGKSYLSARIVLWFLHAYPDSIAVTTAPTYNQVRNILWRSVNQAVAGAKLPLLGRALVDRYEIGPEWYALGFKAEDTASDRFQGFHSAHALVVIDEAAGVAAPVFEALDAVMTSADARMLLIGNPTSPEGVFYDAFHKDRHLYRTITISAEDTPNFREGRTVRPYLITQEWVNDVIAKHGEDSPYVQSRVYARFPTLSDKSLIPLAWVEAAHERRFDESEVRPAPVEAGLDVARYGGDENALCIRRGPQVVAEYAWSGLDTMETAGKVRHLLASYPDLAALRVDVIGVGSGVADRLRETGYPVIDVNVSNQSRAPGDFASLRHELWWGLRERFREGTICGPIADETIGQLTALRYRYDSAHTYPLVESKEEAARRGVRSPDRAEALLLAFAPTGGTRHRAWTQQAGARTAAPGMSTPATEGRMRERNDGERSGSHLGVLRGRVF